MALDALRSLDDIVLAAVIAVGGVVVTAMAGLVLKRLEKKHEVEAQFRAEKAELFEDFLIQFDKLSAKDASGPDELVQYLKDFQRKIVFWSHPKVIRSYFELRASVGLSQTVGQLSRMLEATGKLILAMRKDVGLSNFGFDQKTFAANLILRNSEIFLSSLKENPEMTIEDLVEKEKAAERARGL